MNYSVQLQIPDLVVIQSQFRCIALSPVVREAINRVTRELQQDGGAKNGSNV
jgi:hypothetical protein